MGCAKVLGIGAGVMFGGIMAIQSMGEMAGRSATSVASKGVVQSVSPFNAETANASTSRENGSDREASPRKVDPPATDKETADLLAINVILNGYGCYKVKDWSGDGVGGENILTCVERKGQSRVVRYKVEPLEGSTVML